jgi:hypothetical protein
VGNVDLRRYQGPLSQKEDGTTRPAVGIDPDLRAKRQPSPARAAL